MDRSEQELAFLMAHDSDPFNRWDAGQQLAMQVLLTGINRFREGKPLVVPDYFHHAFARLLVDEQSEPAFLAQILTLPSENWIGQQFSTVDPEAIFYTRQSLRRQLSEEHRDIFWENYYQLGTENAYIYSAAEAGRRVLRNAMLGYLLAVDTTGEIEEEVLAVGEEQYYQSDNMTEVMAALSAVVNADRERGNALLDDFYLKWKNDPLVVDKWLSLQAICTLPGTLKRIRSLTSHPAFSLKNPNKVRSLIGAFCSGNNWQFHALNGEGYIFLADYVLALDPVNPQIAARLLTPLTLLRWYDRARQHLMKEQLQRIGDARNLSNDVREIVTRSLAPGR